MESDNEILRDGFRTCELDVKYTLKELDLLGFNRIVKNILIERRVKNPEMFDRSGMFCFSSRFGDRFHPSFC